MLDFCPYEADIIKKEFLKIDYENLAYELIFMVGHSYEELGETVLGNQLEFIRTGEDERLKKFYGETAEHYMLWEAYKGRKNGMEQLKETIERANKTVLEQVNEQMSYDTASYDSALINNNKMLACQMDTDTGNYIISIVSDEGKVEIAKAVPCCPNCHKRLPTGWIKAEDFCPVSLLGRTQGGKTTLKLSLLANDMEAFDMLGTEWFVSEAHENMQGVDEQYTRFAGAACQMVTGGACIGPTQTGKKVAPLFLMVEYKRHKFIVGLYDNSGEVLATMNTNDARLILLTNMYAHIYLIEPEHLRIHLAQKKGKRKKSAQCQMMTLEEQGQFQEEHQGSVVYARDLLKMEENEEEKVQKGENPLLMLKNYEKLLGKMNKRGRLKEQHLCTTLIKCDVLEHVSEIQNLNHSELLFQHELADDSENAQIIREKLVKEILNTYAFTQQPENFLENKMRSVSYHCISALGCDTHEETVDGKTIDRLSGPYAPIRAAEPLIACLRKKVIENGWFNEEE